MKNVLAVVLKWFASPRNDAVQADRGHDASMPEHERRLREMERSGRILFLP